MPCHMQVHGAVNKCGEVIIVENEERTNGNVYELHLVELRTKML